METICDTPFASLSHWERVGVRANISTTFALTLTLSQGERECQSREGVMSTVVMSPRVVRAPMNKPRDATPQEIIATARSAPAVARGTLAASCGSAVLMWAAFGPPPAKPSPMRIGLRGGSPPAQPRRRSWPRTRR